MMTKVFNGMIGEEVEVYIDDIIAKTPPNKDHISDLARVFKRLRQHNMRLNPLKCTFGVPAEKFLGFMLTCRGVEANPEKCKAILDLLSPKTVRDVQKLNGKITALSRFIPKVAQKSLPLYQLLRKNKAFQWTKECEEAFQDFKRLLANPPTLSKLMPAEMLYLYLSVSTETVSAVMIKEDDEGQKPVYFISRALQGPKLNYQTVEKIAFALLVSSRRLRHYFQSHPITVRTNVPIKTVLFKPDLAERMMTWAIQLSQFDIKYEPRTTIKAQVLANFLTETSNLPADVNPPTWTLHVDGSSNDKGSGAGIVLESDTGLILEQSLRFEFPASNNQAEYEACIAGMKTAREIGAKNLVICSDSQLMIS